MTLFIIGRHIYLILFLGAVMHGFEPNPKQIVAINEAPLFFYTSPELDTWVKDQVKNTNAYSLSSLYENHDHDEPHEENDEHEHGVFTFGQTPKLILLKF